MQELKSFQEATVKHIIERFKKGQSKILVADEVGLGKTLIARGVISKLYKQREPNKIFTVVYICSNQSIANQNKLKLAIKDAHILPLVGDRLSMQSVNICNQLVSQKTENILQIIPLTPETSFYIKNKRGNAAERALICAVLCKMPEFQTAEFPDFESKLIQIMHYPAKEENFRNYVNNRKDIITQEYIEFIHKKLFKVISKEKIHNKKILDIIKNDIITEGGEISGEIIRYLRKTFAQIGLESLKPDLVIMDEFQKFKDLIDTKEKSELNLVADQYFNDESLKVLLLSATPYTLYATQEEVQKAVKNGREKDFDIYHKEFMYVMNFLFGKNKIHKFKTIWNNHSKNLYSINGVTPQELFDSKSAVEDEMYNVMARTEREHYPTQEVSRKTIKINDLDIKTYIQAAKIVNEMTKEDKYSRTILPVDYAKSCPYMLSFARGYKLKNDMKEYILDKGKSFKEFDLLLLNKKEIDEYQLVNIIKSNSKLREINNSVFEENVHNLLWLPPTRKYYNFEKPFNKFNDDKNNDKMTKTLIFSRWEMVPRMISTLFSCNVEQKIYKNQHHYFDTDRKKGRIRNADYMSWLLLLYPSQKLAELYNPIEDLNVENIKEIVAKRVDKITEDYKVKTNNVKNYHYLLPLLLDDKKYVEQWFENIKGFVDKEVLEKLTKDYEKFRENPSISRNKNYKEIIKNYIIASPANCIYRNLKDSESATKIARNFMNLFNKPYATAILDNCYYNDSEGTYWKRVLKYCFSGNLQAVIDEYFYMITESNCLEDNENKNKEIATIVNESMNLTTNTYTIDMFSKVNKAEKIESVEMRTHFAIGYSQGDSISKSDGDENGRINRKSNIRSAFNSPFWPFVLTSTSIGQEGLDFHYYCKRIVHWNLPSNPIDIEQREGRIDRFKSLAIRKYVAKKNTDTKFKENIWKEMFENIEHDEKGLCPYWCLPENEEIGIERIIPLYTLSEDINKYNRAQNILELYRLTLGQERQEDLLINILESNKNTTDLKKLFINLCPWDKEHKK